MTKRSLVFASDIHGEYDILFRALSPKDILFVTGDLINFMDFSDFSKGLLSHAFGIPELIEGLRELSQGKLDRIREAFREITTPGEDRYEKILPLIEESYDSLARSITCETYLLFGNDDYPEILKSKLDGKAVVVDFGSIAVGGLKIDCVSGIAEGPRTLGFPGEIPRDEFRNRFSGLLGADIILTHLPPGEEPNTSDLTFDVIANRNEHASLELTEYIKKIKPRYSFFGHVHNPKRAEEVIGETMAKNLGFFKLRNRVTKLDPDTLEMTEVAL